MKMNSMQERQHQLMIGNSLINDESACYVIAEIGHNHQGDLQKARQLFIAAKEAGADAVKLQKRENKMLFTQEAFNRPYDNPNSFGATYGEHREFLEFNWHQYVELQKFAQELGLDFFSTAFDIPSADFLMKLDPVAFKIASGDLCSIPLLKHVAAFGKPMIISTGGGTMDDVKRAYDAIMPINPQLSILQCTAAYPPEWHEINLRVIETFRKTFPGAVIGLSSHDSGIAMAVAAYMLGARIIEKHFTLNRAMKGTDHKFSLEPDGMRKMVRDLRRVHVALGDGIKRTYESEKMPLEKMSKSIVTHRDLPAGHVLMECDITMKIPGGGISPYEMDKLIGMKLTRSLNKDQMIQWTDLENNIELSYLKTT